MIISKCLADTLILLSVPRKERRCFNADNVGTWTVNYKKTYAPSVTIVSRPHLAVVAGFLPVIFFIFFNFFFKLSSDATSLISHHQLCDYIQHSLSHL